MYCFQSRHVDARHPVSLFFHSISLVSGKPEAPPKSWVHPLRDPSLPVGLRAYRAGDDAMRHAASYVSPLPAGLCTSHLINRTVSVFKPDGLKARLDALRFTRKLAFAWPMSDDEWFRVQRDWPLVQIARFIERSGLNRSTRRKFVVATKQKRRRRLRGVR
jgi:hypothetical protein